MEFPGIAYVSCCISQMMQNPADEPFGKGFGDSTFKPGEHVFVIEDDELKTYRVTLVEKVS
jgi:hypothetical protein